jgi:hypothetical protein
MQTNLAAALGAPQPAAGSQQYNNRLPASSAGIMATSGDYPWHQGIEGAEMVSSVHC